MQVFQEVIAQSSKEWIDMVLANFDDFLRDHADNERKASSMAMSFIAKYPNRVEIIPELIRIALEELEHFQQVYGIMEKRGVELTHSIGKDIYMEQLIKSCRNGRDERFMDRLLIASVVESRGRERFKKVAAALKDTELGEFYKNLWIEESRHANVFVEMANTYFDNDDVLERLDFWNKRESEIFVGLEIRAVLH